MRNKATQSTTGNIGTGSTEPKVSLDWQICHATQEGGFCGVVVNTVTGKPATIDEINLALQQGDPWAKDAKWAYEHKEPIALKIFTGQNPVNATRQEVADSVKVDEQYVMSQLDELFGGGADEELEEEEQAERTSNR